MQAWSTTTEDFRFLSRITSHYTRKQLSRLTATHPTAPGCAIISFAKQWVQDILYPHYTNGTPFLPTPKGGGISAFFR